MRACVCVCVSVHLLPFFFLAVMASIVSVSGYGWLGILPFALDEAGSNGLGGVEACCPTGCDGQCCMEGRHLRQKDATACGWRDNARDLEFVRSLLQWAQLNTCADMGKVFATGFSNGGHRVNVTLFWSSFATCAIFRVGSLWLLQHKVTGTMLLNLPSGPRNVHQLPGMPCL